MNKFERVAAMREASRVARCHTFPHHGHYTVGQHSFDMLSLLLVLNPDCSKNLMVAVMAHDMPERWVGDMPAPAKWSLGGDIIKKLDLVEDDLLSKLELNVALTSDERLWLHGLDRLELMMWAKEQLALGNRNVSGLLGILERWFAKAELPSALREFFDHHTWTRTPDTLPQ